ncbi:MAG: hypothetical protein ACOVKS_12250 [Aquimonas sp.]|jgi:hypothetical protein
MALHWQWALIALALGFSLWRLTRPLRQRARTRCASATATVSAPPACGGCTGCEIGRRGAAAPK